MQGADLADIWSRMQVTQRQTMLLADIKSKIQYQERA